MRMFSSGRDSAPGEDAAILAIARENVDDFLNAFRTMIFKRCRLHLPRSPEKVADPGAATLVVKAPGNFRISPSSPDRDGSGPPTGSTRIDDFLLAILELPGMDRRNPVQAVIVEGVRAEEGLGLHGLERLLDGLGIVDHAGMLQDLRIRDDVVCRDGGDEIRRVVAIGFGIEPVEVGPGAHIGIRRGRDACIPQQRHQHAVNGASQRLDDAAR